MNEEAVLQILRETGGLLEGHFVLSSGLHSDRYVEKFRILEWPQHTERLAAVLADRFRTKRPEVVVGPLTGGLLLAHEAAKRLGVKAYFTEREGGEMRLRRGFALEPGMRVLVVDDVVTTGGSVREVIRAVREAGGEVVGLGLLVDRSGGTIGFGVPVEALVRMRVQAWPAATCPLCKEGVPLASRGSRRLA